LKVKDALRFIIDSSGDIYSPGEIESIAFIALDFIGFPRKKIFQNADEEIKSSDEEFIKKIAKEIKTSRPIQYILGETEFLGLKFIVNNDVLVPRQETEELVLRIIAENKKLKPVLLDLGTGSGCIAITLAKKIPDSIVYACDVSVPALLIAKHNAELNNVEINSFEQDMLQGKFEKVGYCDIIVSNPPYVLESEKIHMHSNVLNFEPQLALFVKDEDPLIFYKAIADIATHKLSVNGVLYVEINENFAHEVVELFTSVGLCDIEIIRDIHDKNRFVKAVKH